MKRNMVEGIDVLDNKGLDRFYQTDEVEKGHIRNPCRKLKQSEIKPQKAFRILIYKLP